MGAAGHTSLRDPSVPDTGFWLEPKTTDWKEIGNLQNPYKGGETCNGTSSMGAI